MIETWKITIPELTGDEERLIYLYLPDSCLQDPDCRYPVLYMFDGHNLFFDEDATYGKCWGMKEYMDYTETPLIIVAPECNHSPDNGRLREYSPFDFSSPEFGQIQGYGRVTMDWMVHTLKPYIDRTFPTIPDRKHTFIAGSSMGGLMSLYALLAYNRTFSGAAALSPSLWTNLPEMERLIRRCSIRRDTVLYMDYGSKEMQNHKGMRESYRKVCNLLLSRNVQLTSRIVPGGTHCEASWERQIPFFLPTLLYNKDSF